VILLGPFAYLARWIWRCLLREDREQQGKHDDISRAVWALSSKGNTGNNWDIFDAPR